MSKQKAPTELPVADFKVGGTGWPEAISALISGNTKQMGIKSIRPTIILIATVPTIALGT